MAADLCFGALGTDTGGSIRIPSSYCGVTGFKASLGRVSLRGVIPLSWTFDHCGPICRTVEDTSLMLQVIAGYDQLDPAMVDVPIAHYGLRSNWKLPNSAWEFPGRPSLKTSTPKFRRRRKQGSQCCGKSQLTAPIFRFAKAFLPRFPSSWQSSVPKRLRITRNRSSSFPIVTSLTRERLNRAANANAAAYAEALHQTYLVRRKMKSIFSSIDLLVTPTMLKPAESFAESKSFDQFGLQNTSPFDVYGLPAITVPCGFTSSGLPIGLQIAGAPSAESTVLALAHAYERETEWHKRHPKLAPV